MTDAANTTVHVLTHGQVVRIPALRSFTRQRVFSLRAYFSEKPYLLNGRSIDEAVQQESRQSGEPTIQFCAEAMVIDGRKPEPVLELELGAVVEIEGRRFKVCKPFGGDDARLEVVG